MRRNNVEEKSSTSSWTDRHAERNIIGAKTGRKKQTLADEGDPLIAEYGISLASLECITAFSPSGQLPTSASLYLPITLP
jgi:hypothetical protein